MGDDGFNTLTTWRLRTGVVNTDFVSCSNGSFKLSLYFRDGANQPFSPARSPTLESANAGVCGTTLPVGIITAPVTVMPCFAS